MRASEGLQPFAQSQEVNQASTRRSGVFLPTVMGCVCLRPTRCHRLVALGRPFILGLWRATGLATRLCVGPCCKQTLI